jgi:hypothetical protein
VAKDRTDVRGEDDGKTLAVALVNVDLQVKGAGGGVDLFANEQWFDQRGDARRIRYGKGLFAV